jgi:hypothetical protein
MILSSNTISQIILSKTIKNYYPIYPSPLLSHLPNTTDRSNYLSQPTTQKQNIKQYQSRNRDICTISKDLNKIIRNNNR